MEVNTLGYTFGDFGPMDSVYQVSRLFRHKDPSLALFFAGSDLQGIGDESWRLDDVNLRVLSR